MEYEIILLGSLTFVYLLAILYWVFLKDFINGINLSSFTQVKTFYARISSLSDFNNLVGVNGGKNNNPSSFRSNTICILSIGCLLILLFLALVGAYLFVSSDLQSNSLDQGFSIPSPNEENINQCNVFDGKWVPDNGYPLYNSSDCPFAERGFNCLGNGRKDDGYMRWRWKPKKCELPEFNVKNLLKFLRDKRVVFVGDSLTRTQWESFVCMLMSGVDDRRFVYEVNQNKISKKIRFLNVRFDSYNLTVEFYRSVFLSLVSPPPKHSPKRVKLALRLDKLDNAKEEWIDSDVLIFNTGHWWSKTKLFETGTYFQVGRSLKLGMPVTKALTKALETWASWIESNINHNRTHVFFRTYEASHWSGRNRNKCKVSQRPMLTTQGRDKSPVSDLILRVIKSMSAPVTALHVTPMGAYRSDAHVGTWSDNPSVPDCSHWCLPGVPDMWNEIVVTYLLHKDQITQQQTAK